MTQYFCNQKYIEAICKDPSILPIIETNLKNDVATRVIITETFPDLYKELFQFSEFDIIATHNYKTEMNYFIEKYFYKDPSTIIKEENYEYYKKMLNDIENMSLHCINNVFYHWNSEHKIEGRWVQYLFEFNNITTLIYFLCIKTEIIKKDYDYPIFENINNACYKLNNAIDKCLEEDAFSALEELNKPGFHDEGLM